MHMNRLVASALWCVVLCSAPGCGAKGTEGGVGDTSLDVAEARGLDLDVGDELLEVTAVDVVETGDSAGDVPTEGKSELTAEERWAQWREFAAGHALLSINDRPEACYSQWECFPGWLERYELRVVREGGGSEVVSSGEVNRIEEYPSGDILTEVVALECSAVEKMEFCLELYGVGGTLASTACVEKEVGPGRIGQVLWRLTQTVGCTTTQGMGCSQPVEAAVLSETGGPDDVGAKLHLNVTFGEDWGVPVPVNEVALLVPRSCEQVPDWLEETGLAGTGTMAYCSHPYECPSHNFVKLVLPDEASGLGMFHELLSSPGGAPIANVYAGARSGKLEPGAEMVGVGYSELGLAQAQYDCEGWICGKPGEW